MSTRRVCADSSTEREVVAKRVSNSLGAQYGLAQPAPRVQICLASLDIASVFLTAEVCVMGKPSWVCLLHGRPVPVLQADRAWCVAPTSLCACALQECPQWPPDNCSERVRVQTFAAPHRLPIFCAHVFCEHVHMPRPRISRSASVQSVFQSSTMLDTFAVAV